MANSERVSDESDIIRSMLMSAVTRPDVAEEYMHALVCALVDEMKAAGAPPEKVVVEVKFALLGEPTVGASNSRNRLKDRERFLPRALAWCVERYYDGAKG
jgi:hypothetical protein